MADGKQDPCAQAIALIGDGDLAGAIALLGNQPQGDASVQRLLALAHFLDQRYEAARALLEVAPKTDANEALQKLSAANARAGLPNAVAPDVELDRDTILAPPKVRDVDLPTSPVVRAPSLRRAFEQAVGDGLGALTDVAWRCLNPVASILREKSEGTWTTWDEKSRPLGLLMLASMRDQLETRNLKDPYPAGVLTAFQRQGLVRPRSANAYRTPDGSWNDPNNPREGSANVRFPRNVDDAHACPEAASQMHEPSPAMISQELLARESEEMKEVPFLNLLATAWIQFMVHDWVSHRTYSPDDTDPSHTIDLAVQSGHPAAMYHQRRIRVGKTMPDPTRNPADHAASPKTINEVTSWWDASQLYGNDAATARSLRSLDDGKLLLVEGRLPIRNGTELSGYTRNWWIGLSMLTTLFAKEHNAICDDLKRHHPTWDDDRLYQTARLVNAAVLAKLHTIEWTPAILPNPTLTLAMETNWYGLIESTLFRKQRKTLRRIKIRNGVMGGLVGNRTTKYRVPYGLTEEFVEVYRLHELLPDRFDIYHLDPKAARLKQVSLPETRGNAAPEMMREHGLANLLYSFGIQSAGQIVLHNYPNSMRQLAVRGAPLLDVAAVDILRSRERGVPRYNELRRQLGLRPLSKFEDLTNDPSDLKTLKRIYRNVDEIDMHVGTRAEQQRPKGFGFGETLFQIFIINASRRLEADHFFTEGYTEENYTPEGLEWIERATFKSVLLRHHPELGNTGLANVDNAFEPWDSGAQLDPTRHPLRAITRSSWLQHLGDGSIASARELAERTRGTVTRAHDRVAALTAQIRAAASGANLFDRLPPGSLGWPIIGESPAFLGNSVEFLDRRFAEHGPIFKTHIALRPTVCFGGAEAYRFLLSSPHVTRIGGSPPHLRALINSKALSFSDGPNQARVQKLLLAGFDDSALESYLPRIDAVLSRFIERWTKRGSFAWVPELAALAFGIIDTAVTGATPEVDSQFRIKAFDALTSGVVASPVSLRYVRALLARGFFTQYVKRVISVRSDEPGSDVVTQLLRGHEGERLKREELESELVHFFLAGAPLEAAMAYHLLLLARHPNVMQQAREEVKRVVPNGPIKLQHVQQLEYVRRTCKESRRAARLIPNTFPARVIEAFEYGGYRVPAGWGAIGMTVATDHDPKAFPRPEQYDPDRFKHPCPHYAAHGGDDDRHRCIGERFADVVLTLLTARLLQHSTWELCPGQDLSPKPGKVAPLPRDGLLVIVRQQDP